MGFVSGLEALRESTAERVLSSGSRELDLLIGGGAKPRTLHLFYGDRDSGVDELVHRLLARCMLQPERGGLGGKAIYLNCGNYRRERTILDSRLLIRLFRASGLDPDEALKDVYVICSFSLEQQEDAVAEARRIVESDSGVKLVVVHNIAKLFLSDPRDEGRDSMARIPALQKLVLDLWRTCAERGIVLVASCRPVESSRTRIPKPEGGKYLGHMSGVIVYLRGRSGKGISAYLVKHPSQAPRSVDLCFDGRGDGLGRITGSFRVQFQQELTEIEGSLVKALRDEGRREAFDRLVEAWGSEMGAMGNASVPTVLDVMLLTALIDNRKRIAELEEEVERLRTRVTTPSAG